MLSFTVQQKNGFHAGACESWQHVEDHVDGKHVINMVRPEYGRLEKISSKTGRWDFYAGERHLGTIDLDELNADKA